MIHVRYFAKYVLLVLAVFVLVNHAAFQVLKHGLSGSRFRAVVAGNAASYLADNSPVVLFIGNSRIMGGVRSSVVGEASEQFSAYNLAYNGLYAEDLQLVVNAFIASCDCEVAGVVANPGIFAEHQGAQEVSQFQLFLSAFDPGTAQRVRESSRRYGIATAAFPLLRFNSEFFLRALYYLRPGADDQRYSNNYRFEVTPQVRERLATQGVRHVPLADRVNTMRDELARGGVPLIVVEPPYHPAFIDSVRDYAENGGAITAVLQEAGVRYFDHAGLFRSEPAMFADPIHLNRQGQEAYSKVLAGLLGSGGVLAAQP